MNLVEHENRVVSQFSDKFFHCYEEMGTTFPVQQLVVLIRTESLIERHYKPPTN